MTLEEIRQNKIRRLINTIEKAMKMGISIDYEMMIKETCLMFGSSRRTSMDYIDIAMKNTSTILVKTDTSKEIISKFISYDKIKDNTTKKMRDMSEKERSALTVA